MSIQWEVVKGDPAGNTGPRSPALLKETAIRLFGDDILQNVEIKEDDDCESVTVERGKISVDYGSQIKFTFKNGKQVVFSSSEWSNLSSSWDDEAEEV